MATRELGIDPNEISSVIKRYVTDYKPTLEKEEVGYVREVGDGIARVDGLPGAMANEMLEFPGGTIGLAMNLDEDEIGAIILGEDSHIEEGNPVKQTGRILSIGVGDAVLGRVINALGEPLDGKGPIKAEERRPLEVQAPGVTARQPVHEPLQTGIKAIDGMTPIGRGQRQLIIGDRQTGKTAIAVDAMINQRELWGTDKQVKCIYVAIGQKASTVAEVVAALEENGALEYTVIVNAPASDPAPFQYLAPYAGSAIGQHWMENGQHALVIYDDLSKQAIAYRQLSLLLRRPPGREAYPGDVFYLHSRLLERAVKLNDELGGGSLTALPIIETQAGDVSAYIPTNVISITDGQIFLEADLFRAGVRPAINVGISVSRVGGSAQTTPMKKVAGKLRLELSQFRELEAFAQFGSELDPDTQRTLARGERLVDTLNQDERTPWAVEDQVAAIYSGTGGFLDRIKVERISDFHEAMLQRLRSEQKELMEKIAGGDWDDSIEEQLGTAIGEAIDDFGPDFDEEGNPLEEGESDRVKSEEERERAARTKAEGEDEEGEEDQDEGGGEEQQEEEEKEEEAAPA